MKNIESLSVLMGKFALASTRISRSQGAFRLTPQLKEKSRDKPAGVCA